MALKFLGKLPVVRELKNLRAAVARLEVKVEKLNKSYALAMLADQVREHPHYSDSKRLIRHQFQVSSQNGEDGIIHEIFRRIGTTDKVFVEIGVGTGTENNTAFLLSTGWSGYWIDGSDGFLSALNNRNDVTNDGLKWLVAFVTKENASQLLQQLGAPRELDFMSLDVDQNTFYVWDGLRDYRPRVVVVEYNAALPPDVDWKVHYSADRTWDGSQNFGASLKAFEKLGSELDYSLVGCDLVGANAFFVRNDLVSDKFAAPFTAENHYEPPRYSLSHRFSHRSAILDRIQS
jgi:hypothetical protein